MRCTFKTYIKLGRQTWQVISLKCGNWEKFFFCLLLPPLLDLAFRLGLEIGLGLDFPGLTQAWARDFEACPTPIVEQKVKVPNFC